MPERQCQAQSYRYLRRQCDGISPYIARADAVIAVLFPVLVPCTRLASHPADVPCIRHVSLAAARFRLSRLRVLGSIRCCPIATRGFLLTILD